MYKSKEVLVVDDEAPVLEVVSLYLRREGYDVHTAGDGNEALAALERRLPDLVVLDLMLPEVDGVEILRWLRDDVRTSVPVIMLTARGHEMDRIYGLEMGADDYVVKPFSPAELVARVKAVLRRADTAGGEQEAARVLEFEGLIVDPRTRGVVADGQDVSLTATEFNLLWFMAQHPRQVFSRKRLLENVWGYADYVDPSTVTVHIRRLREKIEQNPARPARLLTVWGVGYKFDPGEPL